MDLCISNDRDALSQVTFISVVLLYNTNCINRDKQENSMETVKILNLLSIIVCDICPLVVFTKVLSLV